MFRAIHGDLQACNSRCIARKEAASKGTAYKATVSTLERAELLRIIEESTEVTVDVVSPSLQYMRKLDRQSLAGTHKSDYVGNVKIRQEHQLDRPICSAE